MQNESAALITEHLAGQRLSGVCFVMDYVQLQFDPPPTINALTVMTVRLAGRSARSGDEAFRNMLCEQITKVVSAIAFHASESLDLIFQDGSVISMSVKPADYVGPEAINIYDKDHFCLVL